MLESDIENLLIERLVSKWYTHHYGPDIAPYTPDAQRDDFSSPLLEREARASLERLNPDLPSSILDEARVRLRNLWTPDILTNNELFYQYLSDWVTIESSKDGETRGTAVQILDMEHIERNSFRVVNQFVIKGERMEKRPDVIIFVNGLPLVLIELKNASDEQATLQRAYDQIHNYQSAVPRLFDYNGLCVISDGIDARVSSLSAPYSRFLAWKSPEYDTKKFSWQLELKTLVEYMLEPTTLLKLVRYNTVFEKEEQVDEQTGLTSVQTIKKVAAYHQYYAIQKAVAQTHEAIAWDHKIWVVRHTQWSGKSLSMVFYTAQIIVDPLLHNPTILVITDRNDLDDQLYSTFASSSTLLRQTPVQASSREHLTELLKVAGWGIVFSTIQKFAPESGNVFETLSTRDNIIVMADEAHRSQYGFRAREVLTDEGTETRYGNAKYLRDALPNASFIGFTGTPIEKEDRSTRSVFGDEIDIYDIKQAVDDGATVPISYESRLVKIKIDQGVLEQIDDQIERIEWATPEQKEQAKKINSRLDKVLWDEDRLEEIAGDIVKHFEARQEVFEGKAMIVCMTRSIAVKLYDKLVELRPQWWDKDLDRGALKVVMTSSSDDPASFQPHYTNKTQRKALATRFKDPDDELKLVIVRDMWLTGFDVPCLHTMYIDKKMSWANLMQTIARVNRVYKDKPGGLIVDYIGIGQDLRNAMLTYTQSWGTGQAVYDIDETITAMQTSFEIVSQMFAGFDYQRYFWASTEDKLQILLDATNFILDGEDLKKRFLRETLKLSKLYAMAVPHLEAEQIRDQVSLFQAIKSRIQKLDPTWWISNAQVNTAVRQIVEDALSSDGVIDIFQAAGIKHPSLDILSEKFLLEVSNMKQKNLAFELLKKLLNDDIRLRERKNIAQAKKFSEMLQATVTKYHNNQIDTAKVIQELSDIAREIKAEDKKAEELWLSQDEYAFYCVLSENDSTKSLEDHKMKELIHLIVDIVRKTKTTMDRDKREDVRAQLRLTVRKVLMRYGYPPDLARMEADRVLEQSEAMRVEE